PVADFRTFKIDGKNLIAPTGKHDHRNSGILSVRRVDRHRRPRHLAHANRRPPAGKKVFPRRLSVLWPRDRLRIRGRTRPYRYLRMSRRWLPHGLLRAQTAKRRYNTKSKHQKPHRNPPFKLEGGACRFSRSTRMNRVRPKPRPSAAPTKIGNRKSGCSTCRRLMPSAFSHPAAGNWKSLCRSIRACFRFVFDRSIGLPARKSSPPASKSDGAVDKN